MTIYLKPAMVWTRSPVTLFFLAILVISAALVSNVSAQPWSQVAKLRASNGAADNAFAQAVAIDSGRAVVGAITAAGASDHTGAAYIYDRDPGGTWIESSRLFANDGQDYDWFGYSVSVAGNLAIVGAPFASGSQYESGAAYIFRRDGSGAWSQDARLVAPDGVQDDSFGASVAIFGDTAIVGAPQAEGNDYQSGVAYIFRYDAGQWQNFQRLVATDGAAYDLFGTSVAYRGEWIVVGSPQSGDFGYASGAVYTFAHQGGGGYVQEQKLLATGGGESDFFGTSIDISGTTIIVGSPSDDDRGSNAGAAYVFEFNLPGFRWDQAAKLLAADGASYDQFGIAVSIDAQHAAVGAYWDADHGSNSGSAYLFAKDSNGAWSQEQKVSAPDGATGDWFGQSVAISADIAIVGSPNDDDNGNGSGSAYIFQREPAGPTLIVTGSCPGPMQLLVQGATPRGTVALIASFRMGHFTIPPGPCQGVALDIRPPFAPGTPLLLRADAQGEIPFARTISAPLCGISIQVVDAPTCTASNIVQLN